MKDIFQEGQLGKLKVFLLEFIKKYQIFSSESVERYRLSKYQKALATLLLVCLFLYFVQLFGFSFGFRRSLLVQLSVILFLALIVWEVKRRWSAILPALKEIFIKNKREKKNLALVIFFMLLKLFWELLKSLFFSKHLFLLIMIGATTFNLRAVGPTPTVFLAVMLFLWLVYAWLFRLRGWILVLAGLLALLGSALFLVRQNEIVAEKMTGWTYVFLIIGTLQSLRESRAESERTNH